MEKVIYNTCFGGFSLSRECIEYMALLGSQEARKILSEEISQPHDGCFYGYWDGPRHDAFLVLAVEELGLLRASGNGAALAVETLRGKKYIINEYDGSETVIEPHDIKWIEI